MLRIKEMLNQNIILNILRSSVIGIEDLVSYWYFDPEFREVLSIMDLSEDIWVRAFNESYYDYELHKYADFLPLGEILKYFYEKEIFGINYLMIFLRRCRPTNRLPQYIFTNFRFDTETLSKFFTAFLNSKNFEMAGFLIEKGFPVRFGPGPEDEIRHHGWVFSRLVRRGSFEVYETNDYDVDMTMGLLTDYHIDNCFLAGEINFFKIIINKGFTLTVHDLNRFLTFFINCMARKKMMIETIVLVSQISDISMLDLHILTRGRRKTALDDLSVDVLLNMEVFQKRFPQK